MPEESEEVIAKQGYPLRLASALFLLRQNDQVVSSEQKEKHKQDVVRIAEQLSSAKVYEDACAEFSWIADDTLVNELNSKNEKALKAFDDAIQDAKENLGEEDVREAMGKKAALLAEIGEKEKAVTLYREIEAQEKTTTGQRVDIAFALLRLALVYDDFELMEQVIGSAKGMVEKGGDWERRNRLKVYEAIWLIRIRDFKRAADLLLESIATFTATELFDYPSFVKYTVVTSVIALDRSTLKGKVIESPEILQVLHEVPYLQQFLKSLYECRYAEFFDAMVHIYDGMLLDRFLCPHAKYFLRQVRIGAYRQFLGSYRSVRLESMAETFGVSAQFLENDLADLVYCGRLTCKIDAVNGVVESVQPDSRNAVYQQTIKDGDRLLNRIQKISRVITM